MVTYLVRSPLSLARMTRGTDEGSIVYRAEKTQCRRFPQAADEDLRTGPHRNFQVFGLVRSSVSSRLISETSSRRFSAGTRAERWSRGSGKARCAPWPTRAPRRNEARGRTETSRASCNWSSIPNSSDFSGVSQPCRIEETKNFFTGAATERVRAKPLDKASGLAAAKAGLCAQIPRTISQCAACPCVSEPQQFAIWYVRFRPPAPRPGNQPADGRRNRLLGRPEVCERARNS